MMKFLLTTAVACLIGSGGMAQNIQPDNTLKQTERHRSLFGKRHTTKMVKSTTPQNKETETKATSFKLKYAPKAPRITDFKPLNYVPYDTILCTQQNHLVNGQTTMSKNFDYDQYGLYRMVTVNEGAHKQENRYTYQIGDFNFWTSRLIETRYDNDSWIYKDKEERAYNANKQLISLKKYKVNRKDSLYLLTLDEYDWNHKVIERDYNDNIVNTYYGASTHHVDYNQNGGISEEARHEWYEPLQQYVETYFINDYEKRITELKENETVTKIYLIDYDFVNQQETERLNTVIIKYYGNVKGTYQELYNAEGNLTSTYGRKTETLKNTPSEGVTTIMEYQYVENKTTVELGRRALNEKNWVLVSKQCRKGYDEKGEIVIGKDYEKLTYSYNNKTNEWKLDTQISGHWMNDRLLYEKYMWDETDYDVNYYLYTEDADNRKYVDYDPVQKCYMLYDEGDGYLITNYYNLQNKIVRRIRTEDCTLGLNIDEEKYIGIYASDLYLGMNIQEWKNEKWVPLIGPFEMYSEGDFIKANSDTKGNIISVEVYESTNDNSLGTIVEKQIYEYKENENRLYDYYYENGVQVGCADTTFLKNLGNGEYEYYYAEYDYLQDGKNAMRDGSHMFIKPDGLIKSYYYDITTQKWENPQYICPNIVTVDEKTGINTIIERGYDEVTKQYYNKNKRESLYRPETSYQYRASYTWNKERNGWEGEYYEIEELRDLNVPFKAIKYPAPYDDYSKYPSIPTKDGWSSETQYNRQRAKWSWKDNTSSEGEWVIVESDIAEVRPNGANSYRARFIKKQQYDRESFDCDYLLELDEHQQVKKIHANRYEIKYERNPEMHSEELVEKYTRSDFEFTYNAQGFVTEKKELPYKREGNQWVLTGDEIIDQYVFTDVKLTPTAIEEVQQAESLQISGREISAADNALINVYDLSGRKVASGKGKLTLPATGLYLVNCNGKTVKVSCR